MHDTSAHSAHGGHAHGGAGAGGKADEFEDIAALGGIDDMEAALDFDLDDDGNIVENEAYLARRAVGISAGPGHGPGGRAGATPDIEAAFATEDEVDDVRAPPALVNKIKALLTDREALKERVRAAVRHGRKREELVLRMNDEITRLAKQLDEAQMEVANGGAGGGMSLFAHSDRDRRGANQAEEARRRREDARKQLFSGVDMLGDDDDALEEEIGFGLLKAIVIKLRKWIKRNWPLNRDLTVIESRFGSSVASYFEFFRWIIMNNVAVALVTAGFFAKHSQTGTFSWTDRVNVFMPRAIFMSSFRDSEALDYAGMLILCNLLLAVLAVRKWVNEDMRGKAVKAYEGKEGDHKFAKIALNPWDHTLAPSEVQDLKYAMGEQILLALHEKAIAETQQKRSLKQTALLYARRAVGILLSLGVQAAGSVIIILLTIYSSNVAATIAVSLPLLTPFADFIVPAAVSGLNAAQPIILSALSKFEKWDSGGAAMKGLVYRLFFTKMLNMLVAVVTFAQLADPYLFTVDTLGFKAEQLLLVRRNTQKKFRPFVADLDPEGYKCRADQVGAGLLQLVLAEFVISKILMIATPLGMMSLAKARKQPWKKAQHDVAKAMASLLFFTQLVMNAFPWSPFTSIICSVLLIINFKYEAFILRRYMVKPLRPWSANDAGGFFVKFYLISLAIAMFGSALVLTNKTFPKECSLMNTTITEHYAGSTQVSNDPFCTHLEAVSKLAALHEGQTAETSNIAVGTGAEVSKARADEYALMGGEFVPWLEVTANVSIDGGATSCYAQCLSVVTGATDLSCGQRCGAHALRLNLRCDAALAYSGTTTDVLTTGDVPRYCHYACGPFVNVASGYAAVDAYLRASGTIVAQTYAATQEPLVLWVLALGVTVVACFKSNALSIVQDTSADSDAAMRGVIDGLERQVARQKKQLDVFQQTRGA